MQACMKRWCKRITPETATGFRAFCAVLEIILPTNDEQYSKMNNIVKGDNE